MKFAEYAKLTNNKQWLIYQQYWKYVEDNKIKKQVPLCWSRWLIECFKE